MNNYNTNLNGSSSQNEDEDLFLRVAKKPEPTNRPVPKISGRDGVQHRTAETERSFDTQTVPTVNRTPGSAPRKSVSSSPRRTLESISQRTQSSSAAHGNRRPATHIRQPDSASGNHANPESTALYNKVPDHMSRSATRTDIPRINSQGTRKPIRDTSHTGNRNHSANPSVSHPSSRPSSAHGKRKGKKKSSGGYRGTALPSLLKALIYIVSVIVVGGLLGVSGIMIGNDMFALVKSEEPVTVVIGENATIDDVADALKDAGVIRFPGIFKLYASFQKDTKTYVAGTYSIVPKDNSYKDLRNEFHEKTPPVTILSITIPEGYTTEQIIDLFVSNGIGTKEGFVDAIQNYEFEGYWFLDELEPKAERKYRLDGYLYPDTYYFYSNSTEISAIYKLLNRFEEIFPEAYRTACAEQNITIDELVTLASMIQMEAKYESEYGWISSVFNNRLQNPTYETQGYLQSDATTLYGMAERKEIVTGADNDVDGPYNTYTRKGLPVGPISNPSYSAITWALYPTETDYFYFVAKADGYNLFAKTAKEHAVNIITARGG